MQNNENETLWLTVEDASIRYQVSQQTIIKWIKTEGLPAFRPTFQYLIDAAIADAWVRTKPAKARRTKRVEKGEDGK